MWRPVHQSGECLEICQSNAAGVSVNRLLLWASPKDAVAKGSKADGGVVVCLGSIVEMNVQQCNVVPYRCRNSSDQQKDRSCEEEEDTDPESRKC